MKRFACAALVLALAGCATPQPLNYAPATGPNASGFSELRLQQDRFRVVYRAPRSTPAARVQDLALLRAADLTLQTGYDWFQVVYRTMEATAPRGPAVNLGTGVADYGVSSALGLSLGTSFNLGGQGSQAAILEVVLGKGSPPVTPDIYDAADVVRYIGGRQP